MEERFSPYPAHLSTYRALRADTSNFAHHFAAVMRSDPRFEGARLLDVGCGPEGPTHPDKDGKNIYRPVLERARQVDGVEPGFDISRHPYLTERYATTLEDAPLQDNAYDVIVSFNVLEHVADPARFMAKVFGALKPGGAFYATTPHGMHPFPYCVLAVERLGLKHKVADMEYEGKINRYATYYRLNRRGQIARHAKAAGFARATYHRVPCVNWDSYFPGVTKFVPRAFDWLIGTRVPAFAQQLMVVLEKSPLAHESGAKA